MSFTAGSRAIQVAGEQPIPTLLFYPSLAPERPEAFYPYTLNVAAEGAVAEGQFPLVVISHGTGSSQLVQRNLARHLARNGFIVAMPEHPRNNRNNNELAGTAENLTNRPRDVRLVMDAVPSEFGVAARSNAVALIGHSLGGYTALAVTGGQPTAFAQECPDGQTRPIPVAPADTRVKAVVLQAPAAAWYLAPGALSRVSVPILLLTAEHDPHTPAWHGDVIRRGVCGPVEHHVIANAGHFSFLSPFPAAMTKPEFPPSQDPPGFDRQAFHFRMEIDVLAFLQRLLA